MLKNYFKVAFRNLSKRKGFSVINVKAAFANPVKTLRSE